MIQPLSSFVGFQGSWATAKVCSSVGLTISPTQKIEANEPKPRSFTSRGTSELGEKRWAGNLSKNPAEERNFPETKAGGEGVSFEFFLFQIISIHRTLSICCFVFLTIEVAGFVRSSEVPGLCFRWRGLQVGDTMGQGYEVSPPETPELNVSLAQPELDASHIRNPAQKDFWKMMNYLFSLRFWYLCKYWKFAQEERNNRWPHLELVFANGWECLTLWRGICFLTLW